MDMALSPEYIAKLELYIAKVGPRQAAVKMVDSALESLIGLSSSDLADTAIFAQGLDSMEKMLGAKQYDQAMAKGRVVAKAMVKDEGGDGLFEVRKLVKEIVQEQFKK